MASEPGSVSVAVELSGGLELLFGGEKEHAVSVPEHSTMGDLIVHVRDRLVKERPELFSVDDTVRPGILVLINETDWELEGTLEYELAAGDRIAFVSTLHGG